MKMSERVHPLYRKYLCPCVKEIIDHPSYGDIVNEEKCEKEIESFRDNININARLYFLSNPNHLEKDDGTRECHRSVKDAQDGKDDE